MARLPFDKDRLLRLGSRSIARYIDLVCRTSRVIYEPVDAVARFRTYPPLILAFWHGQFLLLPRLNPADVKMRVMLARHGDAELLGDVFTHFDMELIRGGGAGGRKRDRGGAHALRAAVRSLEEGLSVAMTADVPPGPARRAGLGVVTLARLSSCPIVPIAAATTRYTGLDTWSRFTINWPYGRLGVVLGDPIRVAPNAEPEIMEAARRKVEAELQRITERAYEIAGADPVRATPLSARDPARPPAAPAFSLKAYRALTRLAQPAAPLLLGFRERRGKEDRRRRSERLGCSGVPRPDGCLVWLHAASVGETNAVLPLIEALRRGRPDLRFLLTTGTVTSAGLAARRLAAGDIHQYVPFDAPEFVGRFLDHWQPDLAVFTESEIWPSLILEGSRRSIPLALVNARMSGRSFKRWRRNRGFAQPLFSRFDIVLAQNEKLARWFGEVGARRVLALGNIKIDAPPPPIDESELARLRGVLGARPVMVAASTHEGEERIVADAHRQLARRVQNFCTILVPRHPERGTGIAELLKSLGLNVAMRSLGAMPGARCDIYIADTIGELGTLYALAPVAFIGNSLLENGGGQNPIEAIRHGAAVLTGPSWRNFRDAYRALLRHRGALEVRSAGELAAAVEMLLADEVELARMRSGAQAALATLSGALGRTAEALIAHLPADKGLRRAS